MMEQVKMKKQREKQRTMHVLPYLGEGLLSVRMNGGLLDNAPTQPRGEGHEDAYFPEP